MGRILSYLSRGSHSGRGWLRVHRPSNPAVILLAAGLCVGLAGCEQAPDMAPVKAAQAQSIHRYDNFLAVAATGKRYGAAAGNALLRSVDGKTWVRQTLPRSASIVAMAACPDGTFVALDFRRQVWVLAPGEAQWQPRALNGKFNPMDVACDAANRFWVVGGFSTIETSSDKGETWARTKGEDRILRNVQFVDAQHGYISGEFGSLLVTADGGKTWTEQKGLPDQFYPFAMLFTDLLDGWLAGPAGVILHTKDGGQTWTKQANPTGLPLFTLFQRDGRVYGAGEAGTLLVESAQGWQPVHGVVHRHGPVTTAIATGGGALLAGPGGFLGLVTFADGQRATGATS